MFDLFNGVVLTVFAFVFKCWPMFFRFDYVSYLFMLWILKGDGCVPFDDDWRSGLSSGIGSMRRFGDKLVFTDPKRTC